jgi:hypothetical protein
MMNMLNAYMNQVQTTVDKSWLEAQVHKMAMSISAPGADPMRDPMVAAAMQVMPYLVKRLEDIEQAEKGGQNGDQEIE